ncbi:MAG: 16S rRNA (cytosine(1402)-N(4))-methyltransferase RsmH [Anaerolineae bacterium]
MAHISVLPDEVLAALLPEGTAARVIDGTLGAGGHTRALLEHGAAEVLGLDLDPHALAIARETLRDYEGRAHLVQGSYETMAHAAQAQGWNAVDGILLDLGVSSMQLDQAGRGFAFMMEGPLDMRFDPTGHRPPASDVVNTWEEAELREIFFTYGEERFSRQIARAIVQHRPYATTRQLAAIIEEAVPRAARQKMHIHPATRVFQALRIAVNDELGAVERVLPTAIRLLRPGGRLAVISFHSLEDRIVKQVFKEASTEIVSPPGMQLEEKAATVRLITRKPITAAEAEIAQNPRSRSAKLRVVEKI